MKTIAATALTLLTAATAAWADPSAEQIYGRTLARHTQGYLSDLSVHDRGFTSWSRGRWQELATSDSLLTWFQATSPGVADALRSAQDDARREVLQRTGEHPAWSPQLLVREGRLFKRALEATFTEPCLSFAARAVSHRIPIFATPRGEDSIDWAWGRLTATVLEIRADGWVKIRCWHGEQSRQIVGWVKLPDWATLYPPPPPPPQLLAEPHQRTSFADYADLVELIARGQCDNLSHETRGYVIGQYEVWSQLATTEALLGFFAHSPVARQLKDSVELARWLFPFRREHQEDPQLTDLELTALQLALLSLERTRTASFGKRERPLRVRPQPDAPVLAFTHRLATLTLLDDSLAPWLKVRLWAWGNHPLEGYVHASDAELAQAPAIELVDVRELEEAFGRGGPQIEPVPNQLGFTDELREGLPSPDSDPRR